MYYHYQLHHRRIAINDLGGGKMIAVVVGCGNDREACRGITSGGRGGQRMLCVHACVEMRG